MKRFALPLITAISLLSITSAPIAAADDTTALQTSYHTQTVGDVEVFYREAGPKDAPVLWLLHGFPSSSHQ